MSRDVGLAAPVIIPKLAWQALEHRLCQLGPIDGRETKAKVSLHDKGESQQGKRDKGKLQNNKGEILHDNREGSCLVQYMQKIRPVCPICL